MSKKLKKTRRIVAICIAIAIQGTVLCNPIVSKAADLNAIENQPRVATRARELNAVGDGTITIYNLGSFRFTGYNAGVYNKVNASRMQFQVEIKPLSGQSVDFSVYCEQYGGKQMTAVHGGSYGDKTSDGYYIYKSNWFNVVNGVDYRFLYNCRVAGIYDPSTMDVRMYALVQ